MRLLLDTHSFLWFINGDQRLSLRARSLIADADNQVLLSVACVWEIAIKVSLGKLSLEKPFEQLIPTQITLNDIDLAPITLQDLNIVARLPLYHRDPFDRLIIAQAMTRGIPLLSRDSMFDQYPIQRLW
jgi:PIN domain nuclease of toxin-antitoxin system